MKRKTIMIKEEIYKALKELRDKVPPRISAISGKDLPVNFEDIVLFLVIKYKENENTLEETNKS